VSHRYCGRIFSEADIELIAQLCRSLPTRMAISREVCERLDWRRPDGRLRDMSARVALLRMQADGLIQLPAPTHATGNYKWPLRLPPGPMPPEVRCDLRDINPISLRLLRRKNWRDRDSRLWNDLVARYHYLGYSPLPGAQLRYFIEANGQILGLFGFAAAAWKCHLRDSFIGWAHLTRQANLHLIAGNARFLILPWVTVPHLASSALGRLARQLPADWEAVYGYRPALLETFVEADRFGTSYRAANWLHLGQTQGRGKLDRLHLHALPVKHLFVYPLSPRFRHILTGLRAS
jgi:hypothetical protein